MGANDNSNGNSIATTASVSFISSMGLTFLLDKYKDKKDRQLRDEIKERVDSVIDDMRKKINLLETN